MLGVVIGNEEIGPRTLLAAAVILGSVALITASRKPKQI
jgi:drug/metabolite transporter (DMT)-like permease